MPIRFWGLNVKADIYLIDRLPSLAIGDKIPYKVLSCKVPSLTHLRVIGCKCYASVLPKADKLLERAKVAVLMGYFTTQKGYILLDWCTNKLFTTRYVVFKEDSFSFVEEPTSESSRDFLKMNLPIHVKAEREAYTDLDNQPQEEEVEPQSYNEANRDKRWIEAMEQKVRALEDNHTWEVVDIPLDKNIIGSKWVYKIKYKANGEIERFKARLVAKVSRGWCMYQIDIYNAFLQSDLEEKVYIEMPNGFKEGRKHKVCRLIKSLYRLKQESRKWNIKLTAALLKAGFTQSSYDYSLFTLKKSEGMVVVLVYVVHQSNVCQSHGEMGANDRHLSWLQDFLCYHNTKEKLTRMTDASGDTALAAQGRETPLYLPAESGFHDALINILESCKNQLMLQVHLIGRLCMQQSLWRWNKPLCEELDLWGWNSLHYAVKLGLEDVVSEILAWKKSLVYLPAGSENDWKTAIHIAASEGDVNMINELLNHCPDCWDTLNSNNQNALHVAVLHNKDKVVRFLLDSDRCDSLVDEPDSDDNTPLHFLAASGNRLPELINHPRAKKMSFNKQNQTPLDIALSCTTTKKKFKDYVKRKNDLRALTNLQILSILDVVLKHQVKLIGRFGKRDFEVKWKYEYMHNPNDEMGTGVKMQLNDETGTILKIRLRKDDHDKAKKANQTVIESIMESA
ncbi:putative ankyrin repeat-containing protein-like [Capsicum annuum]|nr:putative ankyrin repeat-containing protein-like [Capsicum annuum]